MNIHSYIDAGKLARGCAPVTHGFRLNIAGRLLWGSAKNCSLRAENIQSNNKKNNRNKRNRKYEGRYYVADNHCAAASAGTVSVCDGVCSGEDQFRRQEERG